MRVLAVDPGRGKCGVAVVVPGGVLARRIVAPADLVPLVRAWIAAHAVEVVVIGGSTGFRAVATGLGDLPVPVRRVDERGTTLAARRRYFADHPPRGWRRFLPRSLLIPPEPYDDYAAVVLGEAHLAGGTWSDQASR